ncbi:DegT/DnrJ/EryC1/StrS aminotransferase family protein [Gammaproteobacteria bacterium]|nr:DegT/DnrJ/EryC1/StrS aminotransferase family protein [Gammaproteobacteria bacterium]
MNKNFPLMRNNITRQDLDRVIEFLKQDDPILTQSSNVRAFEEEWSEWLGVKHSVFVNSGSSANQLTIAALRLRHPEGGEVVVPPLTWSSDISAVLQAGFTPVFADINPHHLGMDCSAILAALSKKTKAVFLTHVQGFNALTEELLKELETAEVTLIEDVCESPGATHNGKKLGSLGWASNFSFYYAHHMSTIEGGMLCTNDTDLYETFRMLRSHGMVRESTSSDLKQRYYDSYPDLNPDFIFAFPAYNVRNTEIGAIIGRSQLPRLDENNSLRTRNQEIFLNNLNESNFRTDFRVEGSSNYAFNLVLQKPDIAFADRLMQCMRDHSIEFRRGSAGGGNQLRQPYLRSFLGDIFIDFPETEHIHYYGFYIGNFPSLAEDDVLTLCAILNSVK